MLIENQLGAQAIDLAMLKAQVEQLTTLVAQRDKTISDLQAQLAEAKKEPAPEPAVAPEVPRAD